ncbi:PREDICTED: dickkopf-related protein 2 isoform X1 [Cyprinodon variegatus]|uniref:Dickkopf WNT signaling pathway inhibitor 2 n=1 Tax=Cyprinodon variegatus TaxID=28743 RepID=A0A3Q2C9A5_CYPVA|nr:PREDICTED: dickkopf-related protein 2 isoform X1 [Cyprinodon variegatus]
MIVSAWRRCCIVMFLVACVRTAASQVSEARPKANSIRPSSLEETPTPAANRSALLPRKLRLPQQQVYPCSNDKECSVGSYCHSPQHAPSRCLSCRRRKKRCHRDAMCCPGNRCSNYICVSITESVLSPHISAIDNPNVLNTKDHSWRKKGRGQAKHVLKGHEGDPCLRSSDCSDGYCCARHFWTKICKPVLRQGEVCTKQRKKGSHGLEIFQRCDCAKGLSCKVWKDATSSSKSRLHMCQKI